MGRMVTTLNDGVASLYTDLGSKSESVSYTGRKISDKQLMDAYQSSWIVSKYVDKTAKDMLKKPREFSGGYSQELLNNVLKKEQTLKINEVLYEALTWSILLGDCLVVAINEDENLDSELVDIGEIIRFIVLPKSDFSIGKDVDDDIRSENYGKPASYLSNIGGKSTEIHHSRCHRIKLGKFTLKDCRKYGTSDLQAAFKTIKLFDTVITCIADIVEESNVDVLFLPDLMQKIGAGQEDKIKQYAYLMKQVKSSSKMILLDAGTPESQGRWDQKTASYTGLAEILTKIANVLAGALDRPITVLFGQSASGFSSGEEDNKAYYETILNLQEARLRPLQDFIDKFILNTVIGEDIEYEYPSIDTINEVEESTIFSQIATAMSGLVSAQIISDSIAQKELIARGCLVNTKEEDFEEFNKLNEETSTEWS